MKNVLPGLDQVESALRKVTEGLASELAIPSATAPRWDDFEWCIARAVVAMHGISPLLSAALRWSGPSGWLRFLEEQRNHIAARQNNISQLLTEIDARSRRQGIALVALKGAALHANGLYREGERAMADVDLLVHHVDANKMARLIEACDFELTATSARHQLFEPRRRAPSNGVCLGEHKDNPLKIELHVKVQECLPISEIDITRILLPRDPHAGINKYPSNAALMLHLLLHAAGNMRAHALRLIQLHDIARLSARFGFEDWQELLRYRPSDLDLWWAAPPLALTERYCPDSIPAAILSRLSTQSPWLLTRRYAHLRLADVSWSNIRVYAFPGIEWSRTSREAIRFMITRIFPTHAVRMELQTFAKHHSGASSVPWYGISQFARVLRWLFLKPPRVQTILSVRAAFDQCLQDSARGSSRDF
jgi:hypothetical protein